jgi:hypothetical protein
MSQPLLKWPGRQPQPGPHGRLPAWSLLALETGLFELECVGVLSDGADLGLIEPVLRDGADL